MFGALFSSCANKNNGKESVLLTSEAKEAYKLNSKLFITFMAEEGFPGHAFVGFGLESNQFQKSYYQAYGFHPIDKVKGLSTEGTIKEDTFHASNKSLIVEVDYQQYKKAMHLLAEWREKSFKKDIHYKFFNNSCIKFTKDIAEVIGLTTPNDKGKLPSTFVIELIEENKDTVFTLKKPLSKEEEAYEVYQFDSSTAKLASYSKVYPFIPNNREEYENKYSIRYLLGFAEKNKCKKLN